MNLTDLVEMIAKYLTAMLTAVVQWFWDTLCWMVNTITGWLWDLLQALWVQVATWAAGLANTMLDAAPGWGGDVAGFVTASIGYWNMADYWLPLDETLAALAALGAFWTVFVGFKFLVKVVRG